MRQTGSDKYKVQPSNLEEEGYKRDDIHDLEEVEDRDDVLPEELKAQKLQERFICPHPPNEFMQSNGKATRSNGFLSFTSVKL